MFYIQSIASAAAEKQLYFRYYRNIDYSVNYEETLFDRNLSRGWLEPAPKFSVYLKVAGSLAVQVLTRQRVSWGITTVTGQSQPDEPLIFVIIVFTEESSK
ncbi:unnamed protein product, partial [Nesidiocoris tenuis]